MSLFTRKDAGAGASGGGAPSGDFGFDQATQELRKSKSSATRAEQSARAAAAMAELDKLYSAENFKGFYSLYFNMRFIKTGDTVFLLTPAELEAGSTLLATSARLLIKIDPGYVAAVMLVCQTMYLITTKEAQHSKNLADGTVAPSDNGGPEPRP
jgi:hypothetical protein